MIRLVNCVGSPRTATTSSFTASSRHTHGRRWVSQLPVLQ
uniref:Uncharacterized protein n=1 Tax=Setaria italica TaxID=4555 RepID=K3YFL7_SETIT